MEKTYIAVTVLVIASVAIGIYGVTQGAPEAETAILNQLIDQNADNGFILPMEEALLGYWWGGVSILIGLFLAYGFFWGLPWWPEKAVLIPAVGFIALNVGFSVYMLWGILTFIETPTDVITYVEAGTVPMYLSVVGWMLLGLIARYVRDQGDTIW